MDPNMVAAWVAAASAIAAAIAAFVSLWPAVRAAKASEEQVQIQFDLMREAAQPYVWADIQPDNQQGSMLHLVLGNAGPTMAHNIRVVIDPPIPDSDTAPKSASTVQARLREGILSLAPGRIIRWSIGSGKELLKDAEDPTVYTIHVEAQGPYGEIEPTEVDVRLSDWREARDAPDGSLHHVRGEIKKLTDAVQSLRGLTSRDSSDRP